MTLLGPMQIFVLFGLILSYLIHEPNKADPCSLMHYSPLLNTRRGAELEVNKCRKSNSGLSGRYNYSAQPKRKNLAKCNQHSCKTHMDKIVTNRRIADSWNIMIQLIERPRRNKFSALCLCSFAPSRKLCRTRPWGPKIAPLLVFFVTKVMKVLCPCWKKRKCIILQEYNVKLWVE